MGRIGRINSRFYRFKNTFGMMWSVFVAFILISVIFVAGMVGYMYLEGWDFVDSFYMVVITLSTVGFMEVHPLSPGGRILTCILIFAGVGGFLYLAAAFSQMLVEGKLQMYLGRRRMQKAIKKMDRHFIVCGFGRIGNVVVQELRKAGHDVVVIEQNPELVQRMEEEQIMCIEGDATADAVLLSAGLMHARSLISALTSEAANVYVTLTARQLNPKIQIIARASELSHIQRLELAGADRVVMPHIIGGMRMAQNVLRPNVTNFLELAMRGSIDLQMEEMNVSPASELVGKDLMSSDLRPRFNLIIIGIKRPDGTMVFNPGPKEVIQSGDTLLAVGKPENLKQAEVVL